MIRILFAVLMLIVPVSLLEAQIRETCSDGDFSYNPPWLGDTSLWFMTPDGRLQSDCQLANSTFYICTPSSLADSAQWEFSVSIRFNPSSANYIDVYLMASDSALASASTLGYFVRIGNTEDDICLYRKDSGSVTRLIDGVNGILNSSSSDLRIRVLRNPRGRWELWRNIGESYYYHEGSVTDSTFKESRYFALYIRQSSSGFFNRHFFDDIFAGYVVPDTVRPRLLSAIVTAGNGLDLLFSEQLSPSGIGDTAFYLVDNGVGHPYLAGQDSLNPSLVHLFFRDSFMIRQNYSVSAMGVRDVNDNLLLPGSVLFVLYQPRPYDLIIDEVMPDPTPAVSLPETEWVELKNISGMPVNTEGWRLCAGEETSGPMPSFLLLPDSFLLVTSSSSLPAMSGLGKTLSVSSFPNLKNEEDVLFLRSPDGMSIHSVHYYSGWHDNEVKKLGGWSLEMVDAQNPCGSTGNWRSSLSPAGGTPGKVNSVENGNPDLSPPMVQYGIGMDSTRILVFFSESLDSISAADRTNYQLAGGAVQILSVLPEPPLFEKVFIETTGLDSAILYELAISGVRDCAGNSVPQQLFIGRKSKADSADIVINEILFNPRSGGYDYVELVNRSVAVMDMKDLYLAHRNAAGQISDVVSVMNVSRPLQPGGLMLVTEDSNSVKRDYTVMYPERLIQADNLPSFPDDSGNVVLLNERGDVIDEVAYSKRWHFALISDAEGVALERISPESSSSDPRNWHSAASDVGYGTPTDKNSQYRPVLDMSAGVRAEPDVISPDNDGVDDFITLYYSFTETGNLINMTVFDVSGRPVRYLLQSAIAGSKGFFRWDGLDNYGRKPISGMYIILTEVINMNGSIRKFKTPVALVNLR